MSLDAWAEVQPAMGTRLRVISFDLRRHGASEKSGPFELDDYVLSGDFKYTRNCALNLPIQIGQA